MGASKAWSSQNNQRSIHISNPLSLKKSERKSKEFEVGTYILLEIDWSERWGVEPWSEDEVWCENLSVKRYFNFGGFEDLGVLKFLFEDWNLKFCENSNLLGFSFKLLFTIWGFSFSDILGAHEGLSYFFHAYFEGFYGRWNRSVKKMHIPKVTVERGE